MVWRQGGLNGLDWAGKDRCINLMPRSLRWHSLWYTYRYFLYGISLIYVIVGLVTLYSCWSSYRSYENQKTDFVPVSYTHLAGKLCDIAPTLLDLAGIKPVSYTHLDVYKRQVMHAV